jgi:hypothetical protein
VTFVIPAAIELMLQDVRALERLEDRIRARERAGRPVARERAERDQLLRVAQARLAARQAAVPPVDHPAELPITAHLEEIAAALRARQVVVVCGDTGSGKTTQLPKLCLALGRGVRGMVGHTQPRRIAARSVAARIAAELGSEPGGVISFKVRFAERESATSLVRLMTDGILLAEIRHDPELLRYDTLIIDEAHERSLNIDFLLGYLRRLLPRRPDLRIIITSATIDPQRFARFFDDAPVIEVAGRSKSATGRSPRTRTTISTRASCRGSSRHSTNSRPIPPRRATTCWCSCRGSARSASWARCWRSASAIPPRSCRSIRACPGPTSNACSSLRGDAASCSRRMSPRPR